MTATEWKPTACNLCYANCGILARVDEETGRVIEKVKGDRAHPVSRGYLCNKASRINYYQNNRDRLNTPLRKRQDGTFEPVSWDTAIREVAARFAAIRDRHGGDKIFYYGGGGQGNHLGGTHALALRSALGIRYRSNALAQEKTGLAWMNTRMLGGSWHGDFHRCDVAIIVGKNPWQSNGMQRARVLMRDIGKDPQRTLIVLDPRVTETAELADIHLQVRPGTDVWCIMAILGYLAQHDLLDLEWISEHTVGNERILDQLQAVPVADYAEFAGLSLELVERAANAIGSTRKIALYEDLGVEMSPYSTLCSYLNILLFTLTGAFATEGGMHLVNGLVQMLAEGGSAPVADENGHEIGRRVTPVTGARIVSGLTPCNSISEEILTDHPDRFRAMLIESANPIHSLADAKRLREAVEALEFVVVIDVAMTETTELADYVLPASSQYEKFEATFFPSEFPDNFFHLRRPLMEPLPGTMEEAEIHARLVEALGVFDPGELDELKRAAERGLDDFAQAILPAMAETKVARHISYVLYRTLGPTLPYGAAAAAPLWGLCQRHVTSNADAVRAAGHDGEGLALGNALFQAIVENESGIIVSKNRVGDHTQWRMPDRRIQLGIGEMNDEIDTLSDYRLPERTDEFPLLLCAGERRSYTANTIIRDPRWMKSNNPASLATNPADARKYGLTDAGRARLVTRRGEATVLVELDERVPAGTISLPNGLGMHYPDANDERNRTGVYLNELTDIEDRDPWVGTPYHKHVRARLEAIA
ncbi:MAG: molybdopterin-dependent oxidoreductase [Gammaproteobacteria bacterium]|nr:molybdopterin-dependent oxidoreductase [Gammaproteobacteria bacterium]